MSNVKIVRGQVRQVVKEEMPEVLKTELIASIRKELSEQLATQMAGVIARLNSVIESVENRSKEINGYLVRAAAVPAPAPSEPVKPLDISE